jgi:hypothetical protein
MRREHAGRNYKEKCRREKKEKKEKIGRSSHESTGELIYSEKETSVKEIIGYVVGAVSVCFHSDRGRKVRKL